MSDREHDVEEKRHEGALDVEALLSELRIVIERAKSMPLSSSAIISREEVLELIDAATAVLPDELSRARRMFRERDELFQRADQEARELVDEARAQAAHLVQRTEVVRQARNESERILLDADAEARRIRHETEDYVDRKLAAFEIVLDRTIRTVKAGRERLTGLPTAAEEGEQAAVGASPGETERPFDQDV